jgi:outer membrane protein assembly factor BamD
MSLLFRTIFRAGTVVCLILLSSCASVDEDKTKDWTEEQLYYAGKSDMDGKFYDRAILTYEKLNIRYPFGIYSLQAKIDIAYVYWKKGDEVKALAACERFLREHPDHLNVDYVYYLKALIFFNDDPGLKGLVSNKDLTVLDPDRIKEAFFTLKDLVTRFPGSKYAPDSISRMRYLMNVLALHELNIADHYYRVGAYVGAVNRAKFVLSEYPESAHTLEALVMMSKSYEKLGLQALKDSTDEIIAINFPSELEGATAEADQAWFDRFFSGGSDEEGRKLPWWKFWERDSKTD